MFRELMNFFAKLRTWRDMRRRIVLDYVWTTCRGGKSYINRPGPEHKAYTAVNLVPIELDIDTAGPACAIRREEAAKAAQEKVQEPAPAAKVEETAPAVESAVAEEAAAPQNAAQAKREENLNRAKQAVASGNYSVEDVVRIVTCKQIHSFVGEQYSVVRAATRKAPMTKLLSDKPEILQALVEEIKKRNML